MYYFRPCKNKKRRRHLNGIWDRQIARGERVLVETKTQKEQRKLREKKLKTPKNKGLVGRLMALAAMIEKFKNKSKEKKDENPIP